MSKTLYPVTPPTRSELFTLRLMILFGTFSMCYLLYCLFRQSQVGYAPFYWILMAGITFNALRVLHEWYHYFAIRIPPRPARLQPYTVDIFTTFCPGEPYAMIEETLTAIQAIHYPHTTYLCDEANDPYLIELCQKLGVKHVTRNNRKDAKAGNINNALQYATGELCVILDPDHVPSPEFLDHVVDYFNNPEVGFVQIVQAYHNMGDSLVAKGAAQQTFQFYGPIMACMNSYGTVLAIGANCTFRRAALDSIGGHAAGLAEDMHTAMQLHAKNWKSVYVPAVLTRGLVPSTMSAYYSQQLKWARGTFELLVTSYPKLFKQFTWAQRLHYCAIPLHYFSGVIFFINFLIPILALVTGLIPFTVDMVDFALLGLPVIAAVILIRHYVQRWVMEETERGFHIVGGLLLIGTWWIHILGLVYTVIRKKVPYIPTPKDDSGPDNWRLNIPNFVILLASAGAIVYGLTYDWNPYALVMAGIAGINCLIMVFNIIASLRLNRLHNRYNWVRTALVYPLLVKKKFWQFRHLQLYVVFRKLALPILFTAVCFTFYTLTRDAAPAVVLDNRKTPGETTFYTGIYHPGNVNGLSSVTEVKQLQERYNTGFNIISLYIPWGDAPQCFPPAALMEDVYRNGSLPMITWEPWTALFRDSAALNEQQVMARIATGTFDAYLETFAAQIKALDRPVFLRFAHEPENPSYPWSATGGNTAGMYKAAWKYVHTFFIRRNVHNAIWVWNPWSAETAEEYFPGHAYVDWIGVTCLNYGPQFADGRSRSFSQLYNPFHRLPVFRSGLPVMVAEMGSLPTADNQQTWLGNAFRDISGNFKEIHACILFNSDKDKNTLRPLPGGVLNWRLQEPRLVFAAQKSYARLADAKPQHAGLLHDTLTRDVPAAYLPLPEGIRGINYRKGDTWFRNLHSLTRHEIASDFHNMKILGINTIKRFGPGVYDRNLLAEAADKEMGIHYGFWLPDITDMGKDARQLARVERTILRTIRDLKHKPQIKAWNIANNGWQQLAGQYYKPALLYQQKPFMDWLQQLTRRIKAADPSRPLTVDVNLTDDMDGTLRYFRQQLPLVDAFGVVQTDSTSRLQQIDSIGVPAFISEAPVRTFVKLPPKPRTAFLTTWQDLETRDFITFNGLTDHWGHFKPPFYQLGAYWGIPLAQPPLPEVSILKPALTLNPGITLDYHALISVNGEWKLAAKEKTGLRYEWHLLKTDKYGNGIFLSKLGEGPSVTLTVPDEPEYYRLYLLAVKNNNVRTARSTLNTLLVVL
ncbi:glycosyltransferase [Chitinophaga lutea]|uniref:Glycosyltransferase n=1 Tax=Chitinophaga lutea TaxID=2488634 RepID=A0A3N4PVC5_9BACT|nr:glycosyltransferase [Chitinophaga lutea]RPE09041.1 glycosyltransferase [Chitinophaga lutea]